VRRFALHAHKATTRMHRPYKSDLNQPQLIEDLRKCGFTVVPIMAAGAGKSGVPDLIVGRAGVDRMVEVKNKVGGLLSDAQLTFISEWAGAPVIVAQDAQDVILAFTLRERGHTYYGGSRRIRKKEG
jgi:Holliday junction resolvase